MSLEELIKKATNKEIKLEELDSEDILKFGTLGFLVPTLEDYFNLDRKVIKKIKEQKGLKNTNKVNLVRNIISILDYNNKHDKISFEIIEKHVINSLIWVLEKNRPKKEQYKQFIEELNLENLNIAEEIKKQNIDVDFRLNQIFQNVPILKNFLDNEDYRNLYISLIAEEKSNEFDYTTKSYVPEKKLYIPKDKPIKYSYNIKRDQNIAENALKMAHYKCEINNTHPSFIRKTNGSNYMEPHHLIPLEFQEYFKFSLDVEANIVSLCSNCHNEIHYGINNEKLITRLYYERYEKLLNAGLSISLEILLLFYEYKRKQLENIVNINELISQNN